MTQEFSQTLVVGGGPAGMMAAIQAAEAGRGKVVLLEGGAALGRKILISGNGRCNLLNVDGDDPSHYHGSQPRFVRPALMAFPVQETLRFFTELGIETKQEKRGRLFPMSDEARSVVEVLVDRLATAGVEVHTGARVDRLQQLDTGGFAVSTSAGVRHEAAQVVVSSGGVSVPKLGADDSGMALVEALGHTRTALYPGLVALESSDPWVRRMQGVRAWARVQAQPGKATIVDTDDLLFTKYGVSGFTILNLSARVVRHLRETGPLELTVALLPEHSTEAASELLQQRWDRHPHRNLALSLAGLLHAKIARALLDKAGLDAEMLVAAVTKQQRWDLAQLLTAWTICVTGPRDFDHAEVTIGGIRTDEIDPHTLQSYLVPGLHFAGEMVDVHGDLGGYNFQWAWSSGYLAGCQATAR
ncbi:MAG: NAD(P)/FAD-dependent oxidoreductase [bacterium]|nr:NAD(P)/FAD-dependent oxidoreductase [bacterium]